MVVFQGGYTPEYILKTKKMQFAIKRYSLFGEMPLTFLRLIEKCFENKTIFLEQYSASINSQKFSTLVLVKSI